MEVHDEHELSRAIDGGARIIGVNNRNLRTLAVDVEASYRLAARDAAGVVAVSESGLQSRADVERLSAAGYQRVPDRRAVHDRSRSCRGDRDVDGTLRVRGGVLSEAMNGSLLKICGITRSADAAHAVDAGATALGFVFWRQSPAGSIPIARRRSSRRCRRV